MRQRARRIALRGIISAALIAAVLLGVDTSEVLAQLSRFRPGAALLGIGISVAQVALSAWRWRYTAYRLGIELAPGQAVAEYYLATFANQVLPGGVLGDAARAVRHGQRSGARGAAIRAVVIERFSGQLCLVAITAIAVLVTPALYRMVTGRAVGVALVIIAGLVIVALAARRYTHTGAVTWRDFERGIFSPRALPVQLASSLLVVASYIAVFVLAARAVSLETPITMLLVPIPLVLLAMALPIGFAGWGVRESAAALIWPTVGLSASDGVAASVAYGALILLAALPGGVLAVLARAR